jgi:proliferating cell nuclear antigen PCNA
MAITMTFEARLDDISLLKESIAAIADLIDECEMKIKKDGIEITASDRAVVAVVDFFLSKNAFKEYNVDKETKAGINVVNFMQILKRAAGDDKLKLKLEDNKLKIIFSGSSTRSFTMPLIDVSKEEAPDMKKLEAGFSATFHVDSGVLNSGIEDAELITDSVVFTLRKDQLAMRAEGDSSSAHLELPSGEGALKIIDIGEPVRARYSIDYLKKMLKPRKMAETISAQMATDYPLRLEYEVPNKVRLSFILAPRVEE